MASITQPKYHCTQAELFLITNLAWDICVEQLPLFTTHKSKYDPAFIAARRAEIDTAETLPSEQVRNEVPESARIILVEKNDNSLKQVRKLFSYITEAWKGETSKPKLEAAGQLNYTRATEQNWEATKQLMKLGDEFIAANTADLTTLGFMNAGFPADFTAARAAFESALKTFLKARTDEPDGTELKAVACNEIYTDMMAMLEDAYVVFDGDKERQQKFTFENLKGIVSSPGPAGLKGTATNSATNEAVKNVAVHCPELGEDILTDGEGFYDFGNIASGTYNIRFSTDGYQPYYANDVKVNVGSVKTLNVSMVKS